MHPTWAYSRTGSGALEVRTFLDLRGSLPTSVWIAPGKAYGAQILGLLLAEPGSIHVMDRGYLDFERLFHRQPAKAVFVTRSNENSACRRYYS